MSAGIFIWKEEIMQVCCPQCKSAVPPEAVNIAKDVAMCSNCGNAFAPSSLVHAPKIDFREALSNPPTGTWLKENPDNVEVGGRHRSSSAIFLIIFTCIWSGASMWGLYITQFIEGKFDLSRTMFGIPFLIGTIILLYSIFYSIWGKTVINLDSNGGKIFTGFFGIGVKRLFLWRDVTEITVSTASDRNGHRTYNTVLIAQKDMKLPAGDKAHRDFVFAALSYYWNESKGK